MYVKPAKRMKKQLIVVSVLLILAGSQPGCVSTGMHSSTNLTNVELSQANYQIIARSVSGEARAGYIFGASFGLGMFTQTFGIARVSGERALYHAAMNNLWQNFENRFGTVEGRRLALVNVRYDVDALNLFVYTEPRVTIHADVVEFTQP
jgi:hypothetical protein